MTVVFVALLSAVALSAAAEPKNEVALFQYEGVGEGGLSSAKFGVFRGILKDKISNLKREVLQGDAHGFDYLEDVYVNFRNKDTFTKPEGINRWLKNQVSVLCLLRGTIVSDDNVTYLVKSNFHLGELKGLFPYDVVKITLPVSSSEFGNTQDSHSLVILYALAMDAKRLGHDKSHIARFLTSANNKLADIKRRGGVLSGDLIHLETALMQATNELLGGDNGN
ncbi:MAG: hypothetical protein KAJ45_00480 [Desulfobulbaceae bacterium]|nr:hypothetical protein [Desulfobulbaceae bacterium]MCK5544892.1 hypothetical protein [Desulfobulbaceae bacterium]